MSTQSKYVHTRAQLPERALAVVELRLVTEGGLPDKKR